MLGVLIMNDSELLERYIDILENKLDKILELCNNVPPYYAYGDNEAACYMMEIIEKISRISRT
jgi:hypothetical protein